MTSTTVHLYLSKIPASESFPFEVSLVSVNGQRVGNDPADRLVYRTEERHEETQLVEFDVPNPKIARDTICEVQFSIPKVQVNAVQSFNLTDNGNYILFARIEGKGIEIKQRKDERFGVVEVVTERRERVQGPRGGFVVDPRTGRIITAGTKKPWTRPDAVVKPIGTTTTRETVATNTSTGETTKKTEVIHAQEEPGSSGHEATPAADNGDDWAAQLEKLADLKNKGILTEEEFSTAKARLLGL